MIRTELIVPPRQRIKLLIDMNMAPQWVDLLSSADFEAVHWSSVGSVHATDVEIMAYASTNGFVVLTCDLDFCTILATTRSKGPSVVQVRADGQRSAFRVKGCPLRQRRLVVNIIGPQVLDALRQAEVELSQGALVTIGLNHARTRMLPLPALSPRRQHRGMK